MENVVNTSELDIDYVLIYKDKDLILNNIDFSEDERLICDDIINSLEKEVANQVKAGKTVSIPMIGTIEPNWYRKGIIDKRLELKEYKENHTEAEYKDYFKSICNSIKEEHYNKEKQDKTFRQFKTKVLPKYIKLCTTKSVIYANAWLKTISMLTVVEFDPEIEEIYERFGLGLDADR